MTLVPDADQLMTRICARRPATCPCSTGRSSRTGSSSARRLTQPIAKPPRPMWSHSSSRVTTTFGAMPPIGGPLMVRTVRSSQPCGSGSETVPARTSRSATFTAFDTLPAATDAGRQSTHSMYAISAPSPCRGPSFTIRV